MASRDYAVESGHLTEDIVRQKLAEARGDLFVAACYLKCKPTQLTEYIRLVPSLQAYAGALEVIKRDPKFQEWTEKQYQARLADLTAEYRVVGLEVIHELATMEIESETEDGRIVRSAALAEVKLKAATALRGSGGTAAESGNSGILKELGELYQQHAPRIKEIREVRAVQITYQTEEDSAAQIPPLPGPVSRISRVD